MDTIDWYYVYSERYYPFHFYLQEQIPPVFKANGIFIEQTVFDEHLYKHSGEHFFSRITVKIEIILRILKEKLEKGDARPFLFTDCDILVKPPTATDILAYTSRSDIDMLFQREYQTPENRTVNPGVMMIWPNKQTEQFWQNVMDDMLQNTPSMEMPSINKIALRGEVKWDFFDTAHVCSSITMTVQNIFSYSVYHILCSGDSREHDIGNKMFEAGTNGQPMDKYIKMTLEKYGRIFM